MTINENEINTILGRIEIIDGTLKLVDEAYEKGKKKDAMYALRVAIEALDSLDDRLIKQIRKHKRIVVNSDNFQERLNEAKERFEKIKDYINSAGGPDKFL